jgi:hypothetical protein
MKTPDINKLLKSAPVNCKYGAPMGQSNRFDNPDEPLYVQRVRMIDGDYAPDSTYWGGGEPLYCAFSNSNRIYIRASNRPEALEKVLEERPDAKFVRS